MDKNTIKSEYYVIMLCFIVKIDQLYFLANDPLFWVNTFEINFFPKFERITITFLHDTTSQLIDSYSFAFADFFY